MTNQLNIIQGTKIYIGLPCYDHKLSTWTHQGLMRLRHVCSALGGMIEMAENIHVNNSLIQIARNKIVRHFLAETDFTHLMFIDNDVGFFGDDVLKLIGHDKDIVGGVYPRKMIIWDNIRDAIARDPNISNEDLEHIAIDFPFKPDETYDYSTKELTKCKGLPTGFLCIKRRVFETMFDDARAFVCNGEELREFFHVDMHGEHEVIRGDEKVMVPEHISEDFWFCKKAQEHGFDIWLDPSIVLYHHGAHTFKGNLQKLAELDKWVKNR